MDNHIIHMDINSFAVSVARLVDSQLRNRPVVVAIPEMGRSLVLAVSSEAQQFGIRRGMPLQLARKICRDIRVSPPDYTLYNRATQAILKILMNFTPKVESSGYGHTYLDLTKINRLFSKTKDTGAKIQREVYSQLQLDSTIGVAGNKLVSKIASAVIKPKGLQDVEFGNEKGFIAPLSIHYLPRVKKEIRQQLLELNLRLIKEIAELSVQHLTMAFGKTGIWLHRASQGIDNTPVMPKRHIPNVSEEYTLTQDSNDFQFLKKILYQMIEKVAYQLRRTRRAAKKFCLEIHYSDYKKDFGQKRMKIASNLTDELFNSASVLLESVLTRRIRVRRIAIRFFQLVPDVRQLSFFEPAENTKQKQLSCAIDQIRERFGSGAIQCQLS